MSEADRRKSDVASTWRFPRNIRGLTVARSQLTLVASSGGSLGTVTFQATSALEQSNLDKYFEVLVDDIQGFVSVGLTTSNHPLNVHVGRASSSWGFSSDNGSVWADGREIMLKFGPPHPAPFVLGCGVANYQVFWTINGQFLGFCHQIVPDTILSGLFPTISVTASAATIRYNADGAAERFLFELGLKKRQMALFLSIHAARNNSVSPKERYSPAVAISGDILIVYGGRGRLNQVYGDLLYFDFSQRKWEAVDAEGSDRPPKMYGHSGNCFTCLRSTNNSSSSSFGSPSSSSSNEQKSRRFFLMYGGRMLSLGTRWRESQSPWLLDVDTRVWSRPWLETACMPIGRYGHATAMSGLNFYVHGGFNTEMSQALSDLHVLDVSRIDDAVQKHKFKELVPHVNPLSLTGSSSASATTTSTSPAPRYGHTMVFFENKLYIYGGRYRQTFLGDLWEFNLETATWRQPPTNSITPSARYRHTANIVEGRYMVVVGGNHRAEVALNDIWVLDLRPNIKGELVRFPTKDVWERLFTSIEPTYGHGACVCYGFSEKSFRFRTYSKWSADPPIEGSAALDSPHRLSSKTFWDAGIVIFGGAAETGMNNHPRRLKNSIHWMLLQQLSPKIRPSGSAPDLFSNAVESSSESVSDLITQTRTSRGKSFSATGSILSSSHDADASLSPSKANSSPLPDSSPNIISKSPRESQSDSSLKKDSIDQVQQQQRSLTATALITSASDEQVVDIAVKCYNGNDIRVLSILSNTKLSKLVRKIQKEYDEHAPVTLKYIDPEGDLVTLSKTADLKTAMWLHQSLKTPVLKIHVFVVDSRGSSALTASGSNQIVTPSRSLPIISTASSSSSSSFSSATPAVRSQSGGTFSAQEALADGSDPTLYLWHIPYSELEFKGSLGKGYFGEVKKALFRGAVVACKIIYRNAFRNKHEVDLFVQEVDLMSKLRHPKVISFLGASLDAEDKVIVMEFMHNGSLYDALRHVDTREAIMGSPGTMLNIALDIAQGMSYLHSKHVLHRDLTSKNILLDKQFTAKVSDLGLSKMKEGVVQLSGTFGAIPWQAPEIISGKEFTESADVYSMGCILCELSSGVDLAGTGMSAVQLADKIRQGWRPDISPTCPTAWRALIEECWDPNPEKRPSFEQIVSRLEKLSTSPEFGGDGGDGASGGSDSEARVVEFDGYDM